MLTTNALNSYSFRFTIEPDRFPDGREAFFARIPELEKLGAATWGFTQEEAIKNLQEVAEMVIADLIKKRKNSLLKRNRISGKPILTVTR